MVKQVRDSTGRFSQRPHYTTAELDRECELLITSFLKKRHSEAKFPVSTEDLTLLIESEAEDLDQYADLSRYGANVEGLTQFRIGKKPRVFISRDLSADTRRENRLRTTLTHEYGHVKFHRYLWDMEPPGPDLLKTKPDRDKIICKRDTMLSAPATDWMEWQAGYICGALLMPATCVRKVAQQYGEVKGIFGPVREGTDHAQALIEAVTAAFRVSGDAARVRLSVLGLLGRDDRGPSLFSSL